MHFRQRHIRNPLHLLIVLLSLWCFGIVEAAAKQSDEDDSNDDNNLALSTGMDFTARYAHRIRDDYAENRWDIRRARIELEWVAFGILEAVVEYDFAPLLDDERVVQGLRDVYIEMKPARFFALQVGQFKKPFSEIQQMSRNRLPVVRRGPANSYTCGHLGYCGRDIGFMLSGRIGRWPRFEYAAGLFNGMGINHPIGPDGFQDAAIRLSVAPRRWIRFALSGSARRIDDAALDTFFDPTDFLHQRDRDYPEYMKLPAEQMRIGFREEHRWMTGTHLSGSADIRLRRKNALALIEATIAENYWYRLSPLLYSISGIFSYRHRFKKKSPLQFEPTLMGDILTIANEDLLWQARLYTLQGGLNVHIGKHVRIMMQGEFIFNQGTDAYFDEAPRKGFWPGEWPGYFGSSKTLFVQLAMAN